jgi:hypothetical protein
MAAYIRSVVLDFQFRSTIIHILLFLEDIFIVKNVCRFVMPGDLVTIYS